MKSRQSKGLKSFVKLATVVVLFASVEFSAMAKSKSTSSSLNSLGTNENILYKAQPSVPANTYRVVQRRVIDREWRNEFALSGSFVNGGDSYYQTQNVGLHYDLHFNHRWSIGARYLNSYNNLTPEGRRVFETSESQIGSGNSNYYAPDVDYPLSTTMAQISFYPVYGKVSWFESTVSYFDFYLLLGGGQVKLDSGTSGMFTAGGGMGMWWTQHLTSRLELRYQSYNDQIYTGPRKIENLVGSFAFGVML